MSTLTTFNEVGSRLPTERQPLHKATWDNLTTATNGATTAYTPDVSLAVASVQVTGTFGGATFKLLGSNDDVTYFPIKDAQGNALSFTANGASELSTAFVHYKPDVTGGTGDNITAILAHWAG